MTAMAARSKVPKALRKPPPTSTSSRVCHICHPEIVAVGRYKYMCNACYAKICEQREVELRLARKARLKKLLQIGRV
jgi:hypothetical protein